MTGDNPCYQRLSDSEALMWRMERQDARYRSVIGVIATLEGSPGIEALRRRVELLSRVLPKFRWRVAPTPGPWVRPKFEPDPEFDIAYHLRVVGAPGEGTPEQVMEMLGPMMAEGLDHSRPLWQMTLVEGMAGGRAALVLRLHHTFTDGLGALEIAAVLFDFAVDAGEPELPPTVVHTPLGLIEQAVDDVRHEAGKAMSLLRGALPLVSQLGRDVLGAPEERANAAIGLAKSLVRVARPTGRPCSPLMTGRSTRVALGHIEVPLAEIKEVGRSAGATVNDVFVSALLDGLRRYHAKHGTRPRLLRVGMPISLRSGEDGPMGNHFFPTRMLLPLQMEDPMDRLRAVHEAVLRERSEPVLGIYDALTAVGNRVSAGAQAMVGAAMASADLLASNVPGSPVPLFLSGRAVLNLIPFGPRGPAGLNVTTISYAGTMHVGLNMDPAATPDTSALIGCVADAFDEIVIYA